MCWVMSRRTGAAAAKPSRFRSAAEHLEQLPAAGQEGIQGLHRRVGQGPGLRPDPLGEEGEDLRIQPVGLGQLARGPGEVPDLARISHHDGQARGGHRRHRRGLEAAGRFQHDQRRGQGRSRATSALMPTSSLGALQRSPAGRTATSRAALATSMPTKQAGAVMRASEVRAPSRPGPALHDAVLSRAPVRARGERRATPLLTHGLEDPRRNELSPVIDCLDYEARGRYKAPPDLMGALRRG